MMDEKEIMPYNFFKYGGVYTGEHHGMRYLIKNTGEKPDFKLMVQVWLGPYASTAVPDEKKTTQYFESSVEGRKEAINWLHEQYETRRGEWDTAPALLDAVLPQAARLSTRARASSMDVSFFMRGSLFPHKTAPFCA